MHKILIFLTMISLSFAQNPKLINVTLGHYDRDNNKITLILLTKNTEEIIYNGKKSQPVYTQRKYQLYKIPAENSDKQDLILKNSKKEITVKKKLFKKRQPFSNEHFTFHTGSCMIKYPLILRWFNWRVWHQIMRKISKDPADFQYWLGDNVYLLSSKDVWFVPNHLKNEKRMFQRYLVYRRDKSLKKMLSARPTYVIWDDHDFGPDNSGAEYEHKDITLKLFKNFWGNPSFGTPELQGTFYALPIGKTLFIGFDERYYRTKEPEKHIIGEKQMKWFEEQLQKYSPKLLIIASSSQILNPWKNPNLWSYYEEEKNQLFEIIRRNNIPNLVILSGDRHRAEVFREDNLLSYPVYEFTISPLTSLIRYKWMTPKVEKNIPQREGEIMPFYNYATCEVNWEAEEPYFEIKIKNRRGKIKYTKRLLLRK